jgi:hypothetical protein
MVHLYDTKWKLLSKDKKIRHLESELRHYSSLYCSGCACKKNHAHTEEADSSKPHREAARRGWDCFKKEEQMAALDRIAQFDQENGLL